MNVSSLELNQQDARFMIGVDHAKLCKVSAQTRQDNTWGVTLSNVTLLDNYNYSNSKSKVSNSKSKVRHAI
jgi:hypothetical protein